MGKNLKTVKLTPEENRLAWDSVYGRLSSHVRGSDNSIENKERVLKYRALLKKFDY